MRKKKKLPKGKFEDEFFDDCPICQTMKAAEEKGTNPTLNELKETFKQAKERGGIVGYV